MLSEFLEINKSQIIINLDNIWLFMWMGENSIEYGLSNYSIESKNIIKSNLM